MNYQCPRCNYLTFEENPDDSCKICPVCYWEGDLIQNHDHNYQGGANKIYLKVAKENYKKFRVVHESFKFMVRLAMPNEQ